MGILDIFGKKKEEENKQPAQIKPQKPYQPVSLIKQPKPQVSPAQPPAAKVEMPLKSYAENPDNNRTLELDISPEKFARKILGNIGGKKYDTKNPGEDYEGNLFLQFTSQGVRYLIKNINKDPIIEKALCSEIEGFNEVMFKGAISLETMTDFGSIIKNRFEKYLNENPEYAGKANADFLWTNNFIRYYQRIKSKNSADKNKACSRLTQFFEIMEDLAGLESKKYFYTTDKKFVRKETI